MPNNYYQIGLKDALIQMMKFNNVTDIDGNISL